MGNFELFLGDCLEAMRNMPDNSVDSIVTDPPYGLTTNKKGGTGVASVNLNSPYGRARIGTGNGAGGFMGHKWDSDVPPVEVWAECLRVLKPGGHLLAFAGTRTQHRMAVRIEDAGFEIRDMIAWVYGSGFPKSRNIAADMDESYNAAVWQGWGTALKPALEPITVARKPLGAGTVAANVLEHGTGALNIDGCRVGTDVVGWGGARGGSDDATQSKGRNYRLGEGEARPVEGRWPANLIHDGSDEVLEAFPNAPGQLVNASTNSEARKTQNTYGAMRRGRGDEASADSDNQGKVGFKMKPGARRLDAGSAARFFYCAKAGKKDRGDGNHHPTVKPTDLMAYLCRLVTPPGGVVLDPFMGSGSTGKACMREGFRFIGCEMQPEYMAIAQARIENETRKFRQGELL